MAKKWRVKKPDGHVYGNADTEHFAKLIRAKKIRADDLVAEEGSDNWVECSKVPDFAALFAARSASANDQNKPEPECPECHAVLEPDAVLCVGCGTDLRTGRRVAADIDGSSRGGASFPGGAAAQPRFFKDTEKAIPAVLLAAGLITFVIAGFVVGGLETAGGVVVYVLLRVFFVVALGIPACFLAARLLGTSFGLLHTAVLKLAAIAVLPPAVGMLIPFTGEWVGWILYFALLEWLFELEFYEAVVFTLVLFAMQILALVLMARYVMGALGLA